MLTTFDAQLRCNLLILFTASLLFWASLALLLPTLPLYIEHTDATKQQIGTVMGSLAIGLLLFRLMFGGLADRRGRKIVLLIGLLIAVLVPIGYGLVKSIPMLVLLRACHGISIAAFATGFSALVADLAPAKNRGEIIGYMNLANSIGMGIGPALGGYIYAVAGYTLLFLVSALLGFLGLLGSVQIVNPPIQIQQQSHKKGSPFWQILGSPKVRVPTVIMLLSGWEFGVLSTFVPLFIKSTELEFSAGLFYTAAAFSGFIIRLFTGKASDHFGRGLFITISLVCYSLSMLVLWLANSASALLLGAIVEGVGSGMLMSTITVIMAERSLPEERGKIYALCVTGFDVGIALAGPVLGLIADLIGYRNIFGLTTVLTGGTIFLFLTQSSIDLPNSLRFAFGRGQDLYALNKCR